MATNIIQAPSPVTLTVDETNFVLEVMRDLMRSDYDRANKTKSAAIRDYCERRAARLNTLADDMTRRLYNARAAGINLWAPMFTDVPKGGQS